MSDHGKVTAKSKKQDTIASIKQTTDVKKDNNVS